MIELLNSSAEFWFRHMASASVQVTLLALVLLGVVWAGRRWSPAWRHALLMIALLKFAIPPTLSLPTGLFSHIGPDRSSESTLRAIYVAPVMGKLLWPAGEAMPVMPQARLAGPHDGTMEQPPLNSALPVSFVEAHSLTSKGWLLILHFLGAMLLLALVAIQKIRLHRWACRAIPATDPTLLHIHDELCHSMMLSRRPALRLSLNNHAPLTFGAWKPVVVVPQELIRALSPSKIRVILSHELAHHRRWDLWWSWLQIPISALWWFHPIYWLLACKIRSVREDYCDDFVVASGLTTGEGYCRTLLQAARVASGNALAGTSLAYIGESQPLRRRFRRIMSARFIAPPRLAGTGILAVVVLGLLLLPGVRARVVQSVAASAEARIESSIAAGKHRAMPADAPKPTPIQESTLSDYYRRWLNEEVVYIITREERNVFLALASDREREIFIRQFWARRDTDPRRGGDKFKKEHYRRLAYANEKFSSGIPGWQTDRGRVYILYGEPDGKESHPMGGRYNREYWEGGGIAPIYPFEIWRYRYIDGIGSDIEFDFVDKTYSNNFVLTSFQLPYALRIDYIRLSADRVLVPITIEMENDDLQRLSQLFNQQTVSDRFQLTIYGAVTNLQGRLLAEFENPIPSANAVEILGPGGTKRLLWQQQVVLPPGRSCRLNLIVRKFAGGIVASTTRTLLVPEFEGRELQTSSVILANSVSAVPPGSDSLRPFVIGNLRVEPNVRGEYSNGQYLPFYLQVYNAAIDPATRAPSLQISYAIKSGERILSSVEDPEGEAVQSVLDQQAAIVGKLRVENLAPGNYTLEIRITDRRTNKTVVANTDFHVIY